MPATDPNRSGAHAVNVRALPVARSDRELVEGLRVGEPWARAELFDRFAADVERVIVRILGPDPDRRDLIQDVFVRTLEGIDSLEDPSRVRPWMISIAIFTARERIRRRRRSLWMLFLPHTEVPEQRAVDCDPGDRQLAQAAYRVLDRLDPDDRIALVLRLIEGMELTEVADACKVSLATIKRRLSRAQERFKEMAGQDRVLQEWVRGGASW